MTVWTATDFEAWFAAQRPFLVVKYAGAQASFDFGGETCSFQVACSENGAKEADANAIAWFRSIKYVAMNVTSYPRRQVLSRWLLDGDQGAKAAWARGS
ncbi:hypothetical protein [uncultured Devosia sp.]|uniref:hypothetical protein n=1 Tax=uncultured Devosia sp. TaxID=211434 RepID=UPI0026046E36|nr:hypothetical protein [uncultured Devosia sp.]